MRHTRLVVALALVGLMGAACGGGGGGSSDGGGGTTTDTVTMIDNEFKPSDPVVSAGSTLTLANKGQSAHTFTVEAINEQVEPGDTGSVDVSLDPGSYDFRCQFHPEMTGKLTVE